MQERGEPVFMPDNPAPHITDWLLDIGPTVSGGMGAVPIGWQDLDAWCNRTGIDLDPWEARTIRRLSNAYLNQQHEAKKPGCPAPYDPAATIAEAMQSRVDEQFASMMKAFAKPKAAK